MRCPESKPTRAHELGSDPASCHTCAMQYNADYILIVPSPDFIILLEEMERSIRMAANDSNN